MIPHVLYNVRCILCRKYNCAIFFSSFDMGCWMLCATSAYISIYYGLPFFAATTPYNVQPSHVYCIPYSIFIVYAVFFLTNIYAWFYFYINLQYMYLPHRANFYIARLQTYIINQRTLKKKQQQIYRIERAYIENACRVFLCGNFFCIGEKKKGKIILIMVLLSKL